MSDDDCSTCTDVGRRGYCAPARCYCGHPTCHAHASFINLADIAQPDAVLIAKPVQASSWDEREESTWIDQL